jgi:pilus assembly protein CpaE
MAVRFNIYYFARETGQYLQEVINAFPQGIVAQATKLPEALAAGNFPVTAEAPADIWFIEYDEHVAGLDNWIGEMQHQTDHPVVFLYLQQASTKTLLKALRLGVQECFISQINEDDFQKAIQRLLKLRQGAKQSEKARIIALLGCKGGAGVTFLAVNLAHTLAVKLSEPVLLLDLNLHNSDVSALLDIQPRYTILDVIDNFDRLDPEYLKAVVHSTDSGLDILPGPSRIEDNELVRAVSVDKILHYLRNQCLYKWLILDLGDSLNEVSLKSLENADLILLLTILTIPGLRDAKKIVETLQLLELNGEKLQTVANCYSKEAGIDPEEANKFLGKKFIGMLRFDHEAVVRSINEGKPLVDSQPRHRLSNDIAELVQTLFLTENDNGHRPGRWSGLRRLLKLGGKS